MKISSRLVFDKVIKVLDRISDLIYSNFSLEDIQKRNHMLSRKLQDLDNLLDIDANDYSLSLKEGLDLSRIEFPFELVEVTSNLITTITKSLVEGIIPTDKLNYISNSSSEEADKDTTQPTLLSLRKLTKFEIKVIDVIIQLNNQIRLKEQTLKMSSRFNDYSKVCKIPDYNIIQKKFFEEDHQIGSIRKEAESPLCFKSVNPLKFSSMKKCDNNTSSSTLVTELTNFNSNEKYKGSIGKDLKFKRRSSLFINGLCLEDRYDEIIDEEDRGNLSDLSENGCNL